MVRGTPLSAASKTSRLQRVASFFEVHEVALTESATRDVIPNTNVALRRGGCDDEHASRVGEISQHRKHTMRDVSWAFASSEHSVC
ncbi:hypothetical protein AKJ09_02860 [Labilithrix luteola]|uniref:Uncharacterized protein n=1 Tax=Labilithrix luteola TaxID=1391654 RepID=A0A0K1PS38_9BACT|nr:hypothetical protein AKJ09_02860 [Labilithrix luteola]